MANLTKAENLTREERAAFVLEIKNYYRQLRENGYQSDFLDVLAKNREVKELIEHGHVTAQEIGLRHSGELLDIATEVHKAKSLVLFQEKAKDLKPIVKNPKIIITREVIEKMDYIEQMISHAEAALPHTDPHLITQREFLRLKNITSRSDNNGS